MKNLKKYKIIVLSVLSGLFFGCSENILELENLGAYNPSVVWNSTEIAQLYVNNQYGILGKGWGCDEGWTEEDGYYIQQGAVTVDNTLQKLWSYSNIRRINEGLQDIETGTLSDDEKSKIKGQLYFLRAWCYFHIVFQHGGVPIIKVPQGIDGDLNVTRSTTAECFDFIEEDLDMAIASEINDKSSGGDYGMIDKAAAKAFKGRVLLYKASPVFNPNNPWNNAYLQDAYTANKQAYTDLSAAGFKLLDSYSDLFNDERGQGFENDEYILVKIYKYPNSTHGGLPRRLRPLSVATGNTGGDQPVWEHILLYCMVDGKPVAVSTEYPYTVDTYFQNRDPRFYENIYYNGGIAEIAFDVPAAGRRQYCTDDLGSLGTPRAMNDYMSIPPNINMWDRTGFYPKKGIMESNDMNNLFNNDIDFPFIRLAEVMLNYAEAANETGHSDEAIEMLRLIRNRAGIEPGVDNNYGIDVSSRESIREVIQNETAVELFREGRRWPNMRRWNKLDEWDQKQKHILYARVREELWADPEHTALILGKDPALYQLLPEDFTYEIYPLITTTGLTTQYLPEKYNFFPIQLKHMELNSNLEQNIGWDNGTFNPTLE